MTKEYKPKVYLDYASTSPLAKSVCGKLDSLGWNWFNPSSSYGAGAYNKYVIEEVRNKVAESINADPEEIIFTSSGSEANALAIDGFLKANDKFNICHCTNIEHSSIYDNLNCVPSIKVDKDGVVDMRTLPQSESFCSVMMCNNELGTYQPIPEIAEVVHSTNGVLHIDAVQAYGKIPIDVKAIDIDMMTISGHKIGSLRGVGVLYVKKGIKLSSIIYGTQENTLRGGTYNDLAIKTLGLAINDIDYDKELEVRSKRDFLLKELLNIKQVHLNGGLETRNASNLNIRISGLNIESQAIVSLLDELGFMVSGGSACHSYSSMPSHVLKAIGLSDAQAKSSIRITIGKETSVQELKDFVEALKYVIKTNSK